MSTTLTPAGLAGDATTNAETTHGTGSGRRLLLVTVAAVGVGLAVVVSVSRGVQRLSRQAQEGSAR